MKFPPERSVFSNLIPFRFMPLKLIPLAFNKKAAFELQIEVFS